MTDEEATKILGHIKAIVLARFRVWDEDRLDDMVQAGAVALLKVESKHLFSKSGKRLSKYAKIVAVGAVLDEMYRLERHKVRRRRNGNGKLERIFTPTGYDADPDDMHNRRPTQLEIAIVADLIEKIGNKLVGFTYDTFVKVVLDDIGKTDLAIEEGVSQSAISHRFLCIQNAAKIYGIRKPLTPTSGLPRAEAQAIQQRSRNAKRAARGRISDVASVIPEDARVAGWG